MNRIALTLTLLAMAQYAQAQCGEDAGSNVDRLVAQDVQLCWRTEPAVINVGEHFRVLFFVSRDHVPWSGTVRVDAIMPAHQHGMNYQPVVTSNTEGRYAANGLMFHMPGEWRLDFKLEGEQGPVQLSSLLSID